MDKKKTSKNNASASIRLNQYKDSELIKTNQTFAKPMN